MKNAMLILVALLAALLCVGCGGTVGKTTAPATPIVAPAATPAPVPNPYFNASMIGQTWKFVNGYGDLTVIEVKAAPVGSAAQVVWHYLPKPLNADGTINCRPYWNPGDCSSELWFGISENADSSWSATQFLATCNGCLGTHQKGSVTIKPSSAGGYLVIPPPQDHFTTGNAGYVPCWTLDVLDWTPNNCNTVGATPISWVTDGYTDYIVTPIYTGPVLVAKQSENCPQNCTVELWYFAPNIGLIKVIQLQNGSLPINPLIAMQRVN